MIISEDKFWEDYKPQKNHLDDNAGFDGCLYETFGEEVKYVFELAKKENRVWTVIEGDEGMVYSAGFHYVNRLGFFVTEKPYDSEEDYVEVDEDFGGDSEFSGDVHEVLYNALSGYIQDCAGEGSQEAGEIEGAWAKVQPLLTLDDSEKENLNTILDSLEPTSDLFGTLNKVLLAMGVLK